MDDIFLELIDRRKKVETEIIQDCNKYTEKYGLKLTDKQIANIIEKKKEVLKQTGRVEFGKSTIDQIIQGFCDSPYLNQENYEEILQELIEIFYEYKNETKDLITDQELIKIMKKGFDGKASGDTQYLEGTIMSKIKEDIINGVPVENIIKESSSERTLQNI